MGSPPIPRARDAAAPQGSIENNWHCIQSNTASANPSSHGLSPDPCWAAGEMRWDIRNSPASLSGRRFQGSVALGETNAHRAFTMRKKMKRPGFVPLESSLAAGAGVRSLPSKPTRLIQAIRSPPIPGQFRHPSLRTLCAMRLTAAGRRWLAPRGSQDPRRLFAPAPRT